MQKREGPGFGTLSELELVSGHAPQQTWPRGGGRLQKPAAPSRHVRVATVVRIAKPYQTHRPFASYPGGSGADSSAAGRPRILVRGPNSSHRIDHQPSSHWEKYYYRVPVPDQAYELHRWATPTNESSFNEDRDSQTAATGMAVKSPTALAETAWQPQDFAAVAATTTTGTTGNAADANAHGLSRSRSKKWNPFSRSKSGRYKSPEEPPGLPALGVGRRLEGGEGDWRAPSRLKPTAVTSQHELGLSNRGGITRPATARLGQRVEQMTTKTTTTTTTTTHEGKQFLDVEIPNIQLERYSVMFGSLLEQQKQQEQQHQQHQPSSPLQTRRQVKLQDLTLPSAAQVSWDDASTLPRPRRATSPLPKDSPTFSFTAQHEELIPKLSPRLRSHTSPLRLDYELPALPKMQTLVVLPPRSDSLRRIRPPLSPVRRELLISRFHRQDALGFSTTAAAANEHFDHYSSPAPALPVFKTHQIPETTGYPRVATPRRQRTLLSPRPQPAAPGEDTDDDDDKDDDGDDADRALYEAVEISIARQISVSRQQRRMLVPLNQHGSRRRADSATDAAARVALGKNQRLVGAKLAIPVVVSDDE